MDERIDTILSFLKEIEKYKTVERKIYCSNNRFESDAEHSWHIAMFLILFEKELPKNLDFNKMLKLALIHDLVEIYAGDVSTFDVEGRKGKKEREMEAAKKLFPQLPEDLAKEFMNMFEEYEEQKTREARIVKCFDALQPTLQNLCSNGKSWKENNLDYETIANHKRKIIEEEPLMIKILEKTLKEAKDRGILK